MKNQNLILPPPINDQIKHGCSLWSRGLSHSMMYVFLVIMMCMFMFSCEVDNLGNETQDARIEIPIKEDYLAFSSYDQFTQFLQSPEVNFP